MEEIGAMQSNIWNVQQAFKVISTLNLLSHLWPGQEPIYETCPKVYDAIVIGAGSAGCVIAGRLAEAKFNVLLVEAGDNPPIETTFPSLYQYLLKSYLDWNNTNIDTGCAGKCHKRDIVLTRGKVIGGSGSINGMVYVRGNPHDFDTWADIVNDTAWNWNNVLPFFRKSENLLDADVLNSRFGAFHGTNGPMKVTKQDKEEMEVYLKAFEELGYKTLLDTNSNESIGYSQPMYNMAEGIRWSSAYAYISKLKNNPYLHVLRKTLVTKILFDNNGRANGVEAITEDGKTVTLNAAKEVILSAGTFGSPQILMLSGIGPKHHLKSFGIKVKKDLPVGQNLQDHLGVLVAFSMNRSKSPKLKEQPSTKYTNYILTGYVALNKSQTFPDYQSFPFRLKDDKQGAITFCSILFEINNTICLQMYEAAKTSTIFYTLVVSFHLKSRGYVKLKSTNPKDLPNLSLGWFNVEEDLNTAAKCLEDYVKVVNTSYFKSVDAQLIELDLLECKGIPKGTREYWKCYAKCMWVTEYHYGGTCALGSVVQSDLQVIGVPGLKVADASVMPIVTSGNTNAPTVMIAEKAAQMFLDRYS